ncbi:MAG TPA: aromatic ring-hydroxylating dioxygenase subunit alpha [Polyangia bacterium]|nr:aromatic ring-hydroxylating dioxygenase subunit alpha [Polyangia bacterium]
MQRELQLRLMERLLTHVEARTTQVGDTEGRVPVRNYVSAERLAAEEQVLFRTHPLVVGRVSELPEPGSSLTCEVAGVPLLVVRDGAGDLRAFLNVCRHRGSRLVNEPCGRHKALVCRYHAWTYDLAGRLLHVPQRESFPCVEQEDLGLVQVPLSTRHGFLWVVPGGRGCSVDVDAYLGPVSEDLAAFSLDSHHLHRKVVTRRHANWKLLIDAFLEGYHVKSLHRDSVYRFFLEAGSLFEHFGPHMRSVGARRNFAEACAQPRESWDIRGCTTVFYHLFPNSILVFHPDWVTHISVVPDGTDHLTYTHHMLIPAAPTSDAERAHWDRTFQLIEERVFQAEDLSIAESIQATLRSGADEHFRIGRLEYPIQHFHEAIERALTGCR